MGSTLAGTFIGSPLRDLFSQARDSLLARKRFLAGVGLGLVSNSPGVLQCREVHHVPSGDRRCPGGVAG